jgi:hypothetical protein
MQNHPLFLVLLCIFTSDENFFRIFIETLASAAVLISTLYAATVSMGACLATYRKLNSALRSFVTLQGCSLDAPFLLVSTALRFLDRTRLHLAKKNPAQGKTQEEIHNLSIGLLIL